MTSANPPYPYFNGITYNSQYFASSSTEGLTQAQANALYLRKTTIDSATALETFNAGIATDSIDTTTTSTNLTIGNALNTTIVNGTLNFAKNSSGINPTYIQTISSTSSNTINFHSNNNYVTNYDSRILASGGTASDGQGDISVTSKSFNLSCPLNLGSIPTTSLQLGHNIKNTTLTSTAITSVASDFMSLTITSAGIWLISGFVTFFGSGTGVLFYYSFDYASAVQVLGNLVSSYNTATLPTYTYTASGSTTFTIKGNNNGGTDTAMLGFISATRIA